MITDYSIILCPNKNCSWEGCIRHQNRYHELSDSIDGVHISHTIPDDCPKAHKMIIEKDDNNGF